MKYTLAAACLLASSSAFAQEDNAMIAGFNYTKSLSAEAKKTYDRPDREYTEDISTKAFGVYLGYVNEKNNRFLVSYSKADVDFDRSPASEDITGFDLDWQFVYGQDQIQPYWGIGFGFHSIKDAAILSGSNKDGDSLDGISFQMSAGVKAAINEQVELDISIQRKAYAWQSIHISNIENYGYSYSYYSESIDTAYVQNSLSIGLGFKF
jgi:opacity protein-like surface antigen